MFVVVVRRRCAIHLFTFEGLLSGFFAESRKSMPLRWLYHLLTPFSTIGSILSALETPEKIVMAD